MRCNSTQIDLTRKLITMAILLDLLHLKSRSTIYDWLNDSSPRHKQCLPLPFKMGRKLVWYQDDIEKFVEVCSSNFDGIWERGFKCKKLNPLKRDSKAAWFQLSSRSTALIVYIDNPDQLARPVAEVPVRLFLKRFSQPVPSLCGTKQNYYLIR